jgi:hypothetical protein
MLCRLIAIFISLLASCAALVGCSDSPPPETPTTATTIPWASPAVFVPAGQSELRVPLTGCNNGLRTATLVIESSGNLSLSGAATGTNVVSEINRINYADATQSLLQASGGAAAGVFKVLAEKSGGVSMQLNNDDGNVFSYAGGAGVTNTCNFAGQAMVLQIAPSNARVAQQMLSGITSMTTTGVVTGTFANSVANWDNWGAGAVGNANQQAIRFLSLNISTAAVTASATLGGAGTAINLSMPAGLDESYAYSEQITDSGRKSFTGSIVVPSGALLNVYIERRGNLLTPYSNFF